MADRALRFGVSNGIDRRAATWKLWTEPKDGKFDVYLACRALGGSLKTSMHQSGQWHVAYSKETFETKVKGAIAQQEKWKVEENALPQKRRKASWSTNVRCARSAGSNTSSA